MKDQVKNQNRRLRKKMRIGEFREDCFPVKFRMKATLSTDELGSFTDRFITMIENAGLQFGGGGGSDWKGIVETFRRGSTTEKQRDAVLAWLETQDEVSGVSGGEIFDGWYGEPWTVEC